MTDAAPPENDLHQSQPLTVSAAKSGSISIVSRDAMRIVFARRLSGSRRDSTSTPIRFARMNALETPRKDSAVVFVHEVIAAIAMASTGTPLAADFIGATQRRRDVQLFEACP